MERTISPQESLYYVAEILLPMRSAPSERAEMVSQLLWGEEVALVSQQEGWFEVRSLHDNYVGWVDGKMVTPSTSSQADAPRHFITSLYGEVVPLDESNTHPIRLAKGTPLPHFNPERRTLLLGERVYQLLSGEATEATFRGTESLLQLAESYLHTPYLWGGRSPWGIDCSGFVQQLFRMQGIALARDASQQALCGKAVSESNAPSASLAFFEGKSGNIVHVGLILPNQQIIHASGRVRIDRLDAKGIFNLQRGVYTHTLHSIKQIVCE